MHRGEDPKRQYIPHLLGSLQTELENELGNIFEKLWIHEVVKRVTSSLLFTWNSASLIKNKIELLKWIAEFISGRKLQVYLRYLHENYAGRIHVYVAASANNSPTLAIRSSRLLQLKDVKHLTKSHSGVAEGGSANISSQKDRRRGQGLVDPNRRHKQKHVGNLHLRKLSGGGSDPDLDSSADTSAESVNTDTLTDKNSSSGSISFVELVIVHCLTIA